MSKFVEINTISNIDLFVGSSKCSYLVLIEYNLVNFPELFSLFNHRCLFPLRRHHLPDLRRLKYLARRHTLILHHLVDFLFVDEHGLRGLSLDCLGLRYRQVVSFWRLKIGLRFRALVPCLKGRHHGFE